MPCSICPEGCGSVWVATEGGAGALTWVRLIHTDSWTMTPNRQEANKKRTSDTNRAAVKFCSDITDWTFEVTNTLCPEDWLYADLLDDPTNPSDGIESWFFFGWGCEHVPGAQATATTTGDPPSADNISDFVGTFALSDSGIYAFGKVNPPGFGIDNNGSDPATGDWTLSVSDGPFLPVASGALYSGSDSIEGNAT
jgi:hypothetical protein